MDLRETWMRPLTSSTTCYSGASVSASWSHDDDGAKNEQDDDADVECCCSSFATALHTVQITQTKNVESMTSSPDEPITVTSQPAASYLCDVADNQQQPSATSSCSPSSSMTCVGYSSCEGGWKAIVLLDTSSIPLTHKDPSATATAPNSLSSNTATTVPVNQSSTTKTANTTNMQDDVSIMTTGTSTVAATATHNEPTRGEGGGPRRNHSGDISLPESLSDIHTTTDNDSNNNNTGGGIRAMLFLRQTSNCTKEQEGCSYSTQLSFRPLAPVVRLGVAPLPSKGLNKHKKTPIIWLGSADTSKLYCFTLGETTTAAGAAAVETDGSSKQDDDGVIPPPQPCTTTLDLISVPLSDPAFQVDSPVMALDCLHVYDKQDGDTDDSSSSRCCCCCLGISCQDGTIRFITFFPKSSSSSSVGKEEDGTATAATTWENVQATTIIIDGPSVCLHLSSLSSSNSNHHSLNDDDDDDEEEEQNTTTVHATIGSLCGYVTVLHTSGIFGTSNEMAAKSSTTVALSSDDHDDGDTYDKETAASSNTTTISWQGPFIMAEGFWNEYLDAEDSVLAVHDVGRDGLVALGTHGGRCFLYQAVSNHCNASMLRNKNDSQVRYRRLWECQLPYSIHGICHLPSSSSTDKFSLLVTTRKSVHVFTEQTPKIAYDAALAKKRIDALVLRVQQKKQQRQNQQQQQEEDEEDSEWVKIPTMAAESQATSLLCGSSENQTVPHEGGNLDDSTALQEGKPEMETSELDGRRQQQQHPGKVNHLVVGNSNDTDC